MSAQQQSTPYSGQLREAAEEILRLDSYINQLSQAIANPRVVEGRAIPTHRALYEAGLEEAWKDTKNFISTYWGDFKKYFQKVSDTRFELKKEHIGEKFWQDLGSYLKELYDVTETYKTTKYMYE